MLMSVLQRPEKPDGVRASRDVAEQPVIQISETREDRLSAFQLIYQAYRRANLCEPNPFGVRITPHQLLASTDIFTAKVRGETISTLSLVADSELGLPLECVFPWEVEQRRRAEVCPALEEEPFARRMYEERLGCGGVSALLSPRVASKAALQNRCGPASKHGIQCPCVLAASSSQRHLSDSESIDV